MSRPGLYAAKWIISSMYQCCVEELQAVDSAKLCDDEFQNELV